MKYEVVEIRCQSTSQSVSLQESDVQRALLHVVVALCEVLVFRDTSMSYDLARLGQVRLFVSVFCM